MKHVLNRDKQKCVQRIIKVYNNFVNFNKLNKLEITLYHKQISLFCQKYKSKILKKLIVTFNIHIVAIETLTCCGCEAAQMRNMIGEINLN